MKQYTSLLIVCAALIVLIASLVAACSGGEGPETTTSATEQQPSAPQGQPVTLDGASLVAERCSTCHSLSRIQQASKTEAEWQETVARMVRKGAKLNAEEQTVVIKYLAETYGP